MPPETMVGAIVADIGADTIKYGLSDIDKDPILVPNSIARSQAQRRSYIGSQIEKCRDFSGLSFRRPFEKTYLTSLECQKPIIDLMLADDVRLSTLNDRDMVYSEPVFNLPNIQNGIDEVVFEVYKPRTFLRMASPALASFAAVKTDSTVGSIENLPIGNDPTKPPDQSSPVDLVASNSHVFQSIPRSIDKECQLIVDCGFSSTTVTPVHRHQPIYSAARRIEVGGKFITNYLKELISFRHYNVMDEFHLANDIKEALCFVSLDTFRDLEGAKRGDCARYLLPDYSERRHGQILKNSEQIGADDQVLSLGNECFTPPELLFRPDDIGIRKAGLPEMIAQSIEASPEKFRPLLWSNIVITGGCARLPNFKSRLDLELERLSLADIPCRTLIESDPRFTVYHGAATLAQDREEYFSRAVTLKEYEEAGTNATLRKWGRHFDVPSPV